MAEPDIDSATAMLRAMAPSMSHHHGIPILESAIHAAVRLSSRYITGRLLPDKSVSLLDTACARVAVSRTHEPREIETIRVQLQAIHSECQALKREGSAPELLHKKEQQAVRLQASLEALQNEWQQQNILVQHLLSCRDDGEITRTREALATRHQQHPMVFECVDAACVADVVSEWTGIPLGRMLEKEHQQSEALLHHLSRLVIGQPYAFKQIAQQISISRAGMNDPMKPTGVFLLAGPSGTGKTETALALAELMCGSDRGLVTINMSEYQEAYAVSGLKGSPPGYAGFGQGGVLTEAVRRNTYSVVLLDETEKAHPDVMELFFQIFDKGTIDDAEGQPVSFRNSVIIMTSNLASATLFAAVMNGESDPEVLCDLIRPEIERVFSPALMGRMTLIPYLPLQPETLASIISLKLDRLCQRYQQVSKNNVLPGWGPQVISWVAERCTLGQSGARDIEQVLNQYLQPLLASRLMKNSTTGTFRITVSNNTLVLRAGKVKP